MSELVAPEPVGLSTTRDERTLALISHALSFLEGGIVGPLVIYLLRQDALGAISSQGGKVESRFVAFHSLQSLYFGLLFAGISVPVALLTCGWGLLVTVPVYFIYELVACAKANACEWYRLPVAGTWAANQHPIPEH